MTDNSVDLESLKRWADVKLPTSSTLRRVILLEKRILAAEEFLAKMDVWLKLIDHERPPRPNR